MSVGVEQPGHPLLPAPQLQPLQTQGPSVAQSLKKLKAPGPLAGLSLSRSLSQKEAELQFNNLASCLPTLENLEMKASWSWAVQSISRRASREAQLLLSGASPQHPKSHRITPGTAKQRRPRALSQGLMSSDLAQAHELLGPGWAPESTLLPARCLKLDVLMHNIDQRGQ